MFYPLNDLLNSIVTRDRENRSPESPVTRPRLEQRFFFSSYNRAVV